MATLFQYPSVGPVAAGESYASSLLYFYEAGTTTPITTYTTRTYAVAHANPVVADANGVFAPIYVKESVNSTYRMIHKTSGGATIRDVDNIPTQANAAAIGAALYPELDSEDGLVEDGQYEYGNARRYGAVGDGVTPDDTAFSRMATVCAVTAGSSAGIKSHGHAGDVYYLESATASLRNCHADFRDCKILLASGTTAMLTVGGKSTQALNPNQWFGQVIRSGGATATPTVRVIGAKGTASGFDNVDYLQFYADTDDAYGSSIAYSKFYLGKVDLLELNANATTSGSTTQWINENDFWCSRLGRLLVDGTYHHNHNRIWAGTLEETGATDIDFQVGYSNIIYGIRLEGTPHTFNFASGTWDNTIQISWASNQRIQYEPPSLWSNLTITDAGEGNDVTTLNMMVQQRIPLVLINASTCRTYTSVGGSTSFGLGDNVTSLRGVDLQRLGMDTFCRTANRGIFLSDFIPVEIGDALEIEGDVAKFRHWVMVYDANRALITDAGGGGSLMRGDGNIAWSAANNRYQHSSDITRSVISVISSTAKFIRFQINSGSTATGAAVRWLNAWLISSKCRTSKLAGVGIAGKSPGATTSPTIGFAPKGELVSNPSGGWFTCIFSLDTTLSGAEALGQTVLSTTDVTGVAAGDICGLMQDDGTTHWTTVASTGAGTVTVNDATTVAAASGNRIVFNRWIGPAVVAAGAPSANANYIGQLGVATGTGKGYIAVAVGGGAGDWAILN